jgi:ADP-heptose:LPS heptosyltransferase
MAQAVEPQGGQLSTDTRCYILQLHGGLGARIIQTGFVRTLLAQKEELPVVIIDEHSVGEMVATTTERVISIKPAGAGFQYPLEPTLMQVGGVVEHPMFVEEWRTAAASYDEQEQFDLHKLVSNNWDRFYAVDYGTELTKLIHQRKFESNPKSFIGHLYGQVCGLKWDDGLPFLTRATTSEEAQQFTKNLDKPLVVCHFGMDKNQSELTQAINYRVHKVWSLHRWAMLADKLKDRFTFVQLHAAPLNPQIPGFQSMHTQDLNVVLQLLEASAFFLSTDNYLSHLAASIPRQGIVLWGAVSPLVWGWPHNVNIWNKHSCPEIACWRPGMFDQSATGRTFLCPTYDCMKSIEVDQVIEAIDELEGHKGATKKVRVGERVSLNG